MTALIIKKHLFINLLTFCAVFSPCLCYCRSRLYQYGCLGMLQIPFHVLYHLLIKWHCRRGLQWPRCYYQPAKSKCDEDGGRTHVFSIDHWINTGCIMWFWDGWWKNLVFRSELLVFRYGDQKTWFFNLKYLVFRSKSRFHIKKLGFLIKISGFSIKKLSFSIEMLGFSERCDKWLP